MPAGKDLFSKAFNRILRRDPAALTARLLDKCAHIEPETEDKVCEAITSLAAAGADINARDDQGRTVLSLLAYAECTKAVRCAIEAGADVNGTDKQDAWTPLLWAATNGDVPTLRLLLLHNADPKHRTPVENWGSLEAVMKNEQGSPDQEGACLQLLLQHGMTLPPEYKTEIYKRRRHLAPAVPEIQDALDLRLACEAGDAAKIAEVLSRGAHPDIGIKYDDNAALIYLPSKNNVEGMKLLIDAGADVNRVSPMVEKTPLLNAATHGCKEACKLLIDHDADETTQFKPGLVGGTAIDFARQTPGLAEYIEEQVAERAWARANPPEPDMTLPNAMAVSKPLQLKRGNA